QMPTPIQKLDRLSKELGGPEIYMKRDDLTGMIASGNKVRKLEFIAYKAMEKGADVLITCGGIQSNHVRATVVVATRLGLKSHVVVAGLPSFEPTGNLLLNLLMGADITYQSGMELDALVDQMEKLKIEYQSKGQRAEIIPLGGSDAVGSLGYLSAFREMSNQFKEKKIQPDHIILPSGSGGTQAGLIMGKIFQNSSCNIIGINVRCNNSYFENVIHSIMSEFEENHDIKIPSYSDTIKNIDGYVGDGYAVSRPEELEFIARVAKTEGIILDPVYTGKGFYGLCQEIQKGRFKKGEKVLFVHTGGLFGLFSRGAEFQQHVFNKQILKKGERR
ncbi:MAG: D-cysteine desulfhydrase family protein, partial [Desulfobacula sp.]|nr:D-cysteine desulfhydrase family protein [Desulfobacula sp.]